MQRQKKSKDPKQMNNPLPQTYITSVETLFVHPSQLLYIIIDTDGFLHIFDIPSMSLIGKSFFKFQQGYQVYRCMFSSNDIGLFYTLCRRQSFKEETRSNYKNVSSEAQKRYNYTLNMHYLSKKGDILCNSCKINLNEPGEYSNQSGNEELIKQQLEYLQMEMEINNYEPLEKGQSNINRLDQRLEEQQAMSEMLNINNQHQQVQMENEVHEGQIQRGQHENQINIEVSRQKINRNVKLNYKPIHNVLPNILQISSLVRTTDKERIVSVDSEDIHFTLLTENGFELCSLKNKMISIQYQDGQIIMGASMYGNLDVSQLSQREIQNSALELETGQQYGDIWVIFSLKKCTLIEVNKRCSQSHGNSKLHQHSIIPININQEFYVKKGEFEKGKNKRFERGLNIDRIKKLCLVMTENNEVNIIGYDKMILSIICRISIDSLVIGVNNENRELASMINFFGVMRFSVNTSTTNKHENKILVIIGINNMFCQDEIEKQKQVKEKQRQREATLNAIYNEDDSKMKEHEKEYERQKQRQKDRQKKLRQKQQKSTCTAFIFSVQLLGHREQIKSPIFYSQKLPGQGSEQLISVLKQFPPLQKIWYSEYLENKLSFINSENNVQMIQFSKFVDKNLGKQWVNLGYRFEALDANELYQELEDQFQITAEQSKESDHNLDRGLGPLKQKLNQLNDWSYCLLPRDVVLGRSLKRLNCIHF